MIPYINQEERIKMEDSSTEIKEGYCDKVAEMLKEKLRKNDRWETLISNLFIYFMKYDKEVNDVAFGYKTVCVNLLAALPNSNIKDIEMGITTNFLKTMVEFCDSIENNENVQLAFDLGFVDVVGTQAGNIGQVMAIEKSYIIDDKVDEYRRKLADLTTIDKIQDAA